MSPGFAPAPERLCLPADEVHVWLARLPLSDVRNAALSTLLMDEEAARVDRVRLPGPRAASLVSRGMRRELLGRYLACEPRALRFDYGDHDKPSLAEGASPAFNVSHSGDLVVFAVSGTGEVGVDVEVPRKPRDLAAIARRYFSQRETATLLALPDAEQPAAFLRCFTRKESWVKLLGRGFTFPLRNFDVTLAPGLDAELLAVRAAGMDACDWRLLDLPLDVTEGTGALAVDARIRTVRHFVFA